MNNWKRMYNQKGVHKLWGYTDSAGGLQYVDCDPQGWIDVNVQLPELTVNVQVSFVYFGREDADIGALLNASPNDIFWTSGVDVKGWQPKPLPMQVKS